MTGRRRQDLAARAAAVTRHASQAPPDGTDEQPATPAPATPRAPRARPVRITVDLSPVDHRRLRRWCEDAAEQLGLPIVPAADVVRVLVALVARDEQLAARVRDLLATRRGA